MSKISKLKQKLESYDDCKICQEGDKHCCKTPDGKMLHPKGNWIDSDADDKEKDECMFDSKDECMANAKKHGLKLV